MKNELEEVRLDKWLWAARFFKTRALAHSAIEGGKVYIDGVKAKPSRAVRINQKIEINSPRGQQIVIVNGLSENRLSSSLAQKLFTETDESKAERLKISELQKYSSAIAPREKPNTKDRRALRRLKEDINEVSD